MTGSRFILKRCEMNSIVADGSMSNKQVSEFAKGDIVKLKSGGPGMIVTDVTETYVRCVFMSGTGKGEDVFDKWMLIHDRRDHSF